MSETHAAAQQTESAKQQIESANHQNENNLNTNQTELIDQLLFDQLAFIRSMTVKNMQAIDPALTDRMPTGYRNHIRWQAIHLWFVLERFAFHLTGAGYPAHDADLVLYGNGSSPANWVGVDVPKMEEVVALMSSQAERIRTALSGKLDQPLVQPLTTATGLTMNSARALITYAIFHEGMHLSQIKMYVKLLNDEV